MSDAGQDPAATTEIGLIGGDLPLWRATEAVRHGEVRLAMQGQATQALEGRATSMLGWSVAGGLALGAAVVHGAHFWAAAAAGACLVAAASMCVWAMVTREWSGVPGYAPGVLLNDNSPSQYEALVALAVGYEAGVKLNEDAFRRFERLVRIAICLMLAAPPVGMAGLAFERARPDCARQPVIGVRAALACREFATAAVLGSWARGPCLAPMGGAA